MNRVNSPKKFRELCGAHGPEARDFPPCTFPPGTYL
jgi:hypothetical protein